MEGPKNSEKKGLRLKSEAIVVRLKEWLKGIRDRIKVEEPDIHPETRWERVLLFIGIHIPKGKKDKVHIRPRFFKVLGVSALLFPSILLVGLYEIGSSPRLCNSCHIMKPYYQAWKTSKHNFVPCVDCHYPPGLRDTIWVKYQALAQVAKWATQTYSSKPFAEIEDASCLRPGCHAMRLLEGKVTFMRGIIFDHRPHLLEVRRGRQLRCTSCHSQIVVGTHMTVTESTCFLCHFKGAKKGREENPLAGCPSCHLPPKREIKIRDITFNHEDFVGARGVACQKCHFDVIQGEGEASRERCLNCHNQPEKLERHEDIPFLHDNHVAKHNVECGRCHTEIRHAIRTTTEPLRFDCSLCHEAKHEGQRSLYVGVGGKGSPTIPSHMFEARVDCIACHVLPKELGIKAEFTGQTFKASEAACVGCHGEKYRGMLGTWKSTLDTMLAELQPKAIMALKTLNETLQTHPRYVEAYQLYRDARYNMDFIAVGKGVHNVFYAADLLLVANRNLDQAIKLLGRNPPPLPKEDLIRGGYCATLCHERLKVKVPKEVNFEKVRLPHERHFDDFGAVCTDCHSPEVHKAVTATKESCQSCHHSAINGRCERCHSAQASLYKGTIKTAAAVDKVPNLMAGKVECGGCHDFTTRHSLAAVSNQCVRCHEKAYSDILTGWQFSLKEAMEKARVSLDRAEAELARARAAKRDVKEASTLLEGIRRDYRLISEAKGLHNPELAEALLGKVKEGADRVRASLSKL